MWLKKYYKKKLKKILKLSGQTCCLGYEIVITRLKGNKKIIIKSIFQNKQHRMMKSKKINVKKKKTNVKLC